MWGCLRGSWVGSWWVYRRLGGRCPRLDVRVQGLVWDSRAGSEASRGGSEGRGQDLRLESWI